jgi:hypothetical protein
MDCESGTNRCASKAAHENGVITEADFPAKLAQERARAKKAHRDSSERESVQSFSVRLVNDWNVLNVWNDWNQLTRR